jgi:hypothetical protein
LLIAISHRIFLLLVTSHRSCAYLRPLYPLLSTQNGFPIHDFRPANLPFLRCFSPHRQALQKGNQEGAQIYAQNAIRKKTEGLNLLRLASRIDAVASRVETAVTMRSVTNSMGSVVKGMDKAMESMNLERVC